MKRILVSLLLVFALHASAQDLQRVELSIDGVAREALVHAPASAKEKTAPLVFVWHGHGGNMRNTTRSFAIQRHWPEAIAVYPQGLNTPGRLTDPEGKKPGWQGRIGDQGDRDLKFFDALLAKLNADYKVDTKRIYSTGHSNGGGFTYLLWAARGDLFASVAPSAAASARNNGAAAMLKPKPAMHLAGEKDQFVKYEWQQAAMAAVRKLNGCETEGGTWDKQCLIYESKTGTPFVSFIHPGGHNFPAEAPALIVKFFKQHPAK
ncbi:MAG: esterase [Chthoniobacteraceae bacterium]